ncbi:ABC-type multidrug transport system, ATPase component [Clostridium pasteurianum DSM 525 = ATCC 6013]|uniref:AAA ATPase n=2 Tax=Clostridium pasteurianum TaxID=1501 RepID=A0A0H3J1V3_CLOPA|nr:ABC transporter ATP-binding protein [Clostridium pasteurianum]AJA47394.1 ABC-type multidrug transport system, ATPase component [Clostridium pasteurianum DSM 525 = ATCC 6013]AJA51382.1 ABC-type multidrug transport system, ATPase component [Clostridium pasteurianum DSM 525 = ATCC 6013]AOZ74722.1 hypothetical protein AQ983_06245 [Clostridium pasteurianum DSM 525 = ATCC 6013]AOZ78518.1 hypothetical protein AQ984_06235 [Clostridium pasteurianum]ELP58730.1 ABC transporter ATP-binding protein [Clo
MLKIRGLNYSYDNVKNVLDNINFTIEEGKVYCLLGENGSGKTTLFKCLNGEVKCNLKKIVCNDDILFIHDEMKFYYYLTGKEYISLIMNFKSRSFNKEYYEYLLYKLKMEDKINNKIFSYSLGMKHKLVLITAFLLNYKYILMDEPFTALDYISSEIVIDIVREYVKKNRAIVISTHMLDIAQEIGDKILLLKDGKIVELENSFENSKELKKKIKEINEKLL